MSKLSRLAVLVTTSVTVVAAPAFAGDGEGAEHDAPFVAFDLGAEAGEATEATAALLVGYEHGANNFLVSAALARGHGETAFADLAVGYYRAFELGWVTPEVGVELGVLNESVEDNGERSHHLTMLERVGGALLHHFENHVFAGIATDVNFAKDEFANVRGLFEIGYRL